jgi:hypothetical protein
MNAVMDTVKKAISSGSEEEDVVTSAIEGTTVKIPSSAFLGLALASIGVSLACQITGRKQLSNFVGQWAPTFLILGLYNKVVKQHGH